MNTNSSDKKTVEEQQMRSSKNRTVKYAVKFVSALLLASLFFAGFSSCSSMYARSRSSINAQSRDNINASEQWEYKVLKSSSNAKKMEEIFNELGREGWEYVGNGSYKYTRPVFRRKIQ